MRTMRDNPYHWQATIFFFAVKTKRQKAKRTWQATAYTKRQKDNPYHCHLISFYAIDSIVVVDSVDIVEFVGCVGFVVVIGSTVDFVVLIDSFCCRCFNEYKQILKGANAWGRLGKPTHCARESPQVERSHYFKPVLFHQF